MIARFDQFQFLTNRQNFVLPSAETLEIFVSHETGTRVPPDKFHHRGFSVTDENWKELFGDGKDVPARLLWEAIVEYAGFQRAGCIALDDQRRPSPAQVGFGVFRRANQFDACTALANVGLEDERKIYSEPSANFVERAQSRGQRVSHDQFRFRREFRTG